MNTSTKINGIWHSENFLEASVEIEKLFAQAKQVVRSLENLGQDGDITMASQALQIKVQFMIDFAQGISEFSNIKLVEELKEVSDKVQEMSKDVL